MFAGTRDKMVKQNHDARDTAQCVELMEVGGGLAHRIAGKNALPQSDVEVLQDQLSPTPAHRRSEKYRFDSDAITPLSNSSATRFGIAISPFIMSEKFHSASLFHTEPMKTAATHRRR